MTTPFTLSQRTSRSDESSLVEQLRQQALAVLEKTLDPEHLDMAKDLNDSTKQLY
jgi:hypothetical protein